MVRDHGDPLERHVAVTQARIELVDLAVKCYDELQNNPLRNFAKGVHSVEVQAPEERFNTRRAFRQAFEGFDSIRSLGALLHSFQRSGCCMNLDCRACVDFRLLFSGLTLCLGKSPPTGISFPKCATCLVFSYCEFSFCFNENVDGRILIIVHLQARDIVKVSLGQTRYLPSP